jgi:D-glycero-alpha-D-manno-heptose-7-phosphate kinase
MILSKTPFRISFAGGGSDYLLKNSNSVGNVVSVTINKFIYIMVNKKHDNKYRVSYSQTENTNNLDDVKHEIIRNCVKFSGIEDYLEIVTMADIPSSGSGLGSSSSLTVGLLKALYKFKKKKISNYDLAMKSYFIESKLCNKPIGLQDQFNASHGNLRHYIFNSNGTVLNKKIKINKIRLKDFKKNLILFYTGINRKADKIIKKINNNKNIINFKKLSDLALDFKQELENGDLNNLGKILNENWNIKRKLDSSVSSSEIDHFYTLALKNGATGGKILGAGGGGYFLFFAKKEFHKLLEKKLKPMIKINFDFYDKGSELIYND